MIGNLFQPSKSLVAKLILSVGATLLLALSIWATFNIRYQEERMMDNIVVGTDRLSNTILLGTHYAMMLNSRDDINQIIKNIGKQKEIEEVRIFNKEGQIKFSNHHAEVDRITAIEAEACDVCHRSDPPLLDLDITQKTRIFTSPKGYRMLGIISPIRNEPGCSTGGCHVHPAGKTILGALDVVISLADTDREIQSSQRGLIGLTVFLFVLISLMIFLSVIWFVNRPIRRLIESTRVIASGDYEGVPTTSSQDEVGQLAAAIRSMGGEIGKHAAELGRQKNEYQDLFERVPCLITVQDRNFRLLRYNREFSDLFAPTLGDYCFHAYKGRDCKCTVCPVEKTFRDGQSHYSEETGVNRDGTTSYWMVRTSPIRDTEGNIVAAMEINLDITERKQLEVELEKSEKKYHAIFSNIPNPVFVLDTETLCILDCNDRVTAIYGYAVEEMLEHSFLDLFPVEERDIYADTIKTTTVINQAKQVKKNGRQLFVNIRISPSEYSRQQVFLVTTSDITKRLETEQQLIQASKMATLGEMATGIAHELNQPLSVIKTASSFFMGKIEREEAFEAEVLFKMLGKIDTNVDRASKIINHMRQFARKSDMVLVKTQANEVIRNAFEIFSQQLKLRGIEVIWSLDPVLPGINADPDRLEQVFINLLINARDAIDERWEAQGGTTGSTNAGEKVITLSTRCENGHVIMEVADTGIGIPPAVMDKIFDPFFTTKDVGKGTGLGLSISYGIVKECGGEIWVASRPGEGTTFTMEFNLKKAADEPDSD